MKANLLIPLIKKLIPFFIIISSNSIAQSDQETISKKPVRIPPTLTEESLSILQKQNGVRNSFDEEPILHIPDDCEKPQFPDNFIKTEKSGIVALRLLIERDGRVSESKIEATSGDKRLDEVARIAIQKCKFKPLLKEGKISTGWIKIQYFWKSDLNTLNEKNQSSVNQEILTTGRTSAVVDANNCLKPVYPSDALKQSRSGVVTVKFLIDVNGQVAASQIEKSSGHEDLDAAAVNGLSLCRFVPQKFNGKPEQAWTRMQYVWKIAPSAQPSSSNIVAAKVDPKNCKKPEYPAKSLRNENSGIVTIALLIDDDGQVIESRIEKSSGYKELDDAAEKGLGLCKFKPATRNGRTIPSWIRMQYVWEAY